MHIARSILSNWFATAAVMAVGFFLSPFIVHRLGVVAYGVWVLTISSINYMAILDLGMASSVIRFVSKGHATQDHEGSSEQANVPTPNGFDVGIPTSCTTAHGRAQPKLIGN